MLGNQTLLNSPNHFLTFGKQQPTFNWRTLSFGKPDHHIDRDDAASILFKELIILDDLSRFREEPNHFGFRAKLSESGGANCEQQQAGDHDCSGMLHDESAKRLPDIGKRAFRACRLLGHELQQRRKRVQNHSQAHEAAERRIYAEMSNGSQGTCRQ